MNQLNSDAAALAPTRRVWMTLSGDYKKRGAALLHQQCWCWGYDVRRQVGGERANLLVELGFERVPAPDGVHGATTYRLRQSDGSTVTLWGFGLCFGDEHGGIFVSRFAFWPRLGATAAPEMAFAAKHLASFRAAKRLDECERALDYFGRALGWIAHYEQLAADVAGTSHRAAALEAWSRGVASHKALAPETLAQTWRDLAAQCPQVARLWCRENNRTRQIERPVARPLLPTPANLGMVTALPDAYAASPDLTAMIAPATFATESASVSANGAQ